ncbi:MAG: cytochrome c [Bacteroidetes bacterium]|nr:cytochrome c [Bacteroidota bacterium]
MKSKVVLMSVMFLLGSFMLFSFASFQQQKGKEWATPDKYAKMKNPVKADDKTLATGKALWNKNCKSCHGVKGLGDGTKGAGLKTFPGDFSSKAFQGLSDGVLFFRTTMGRDEMPSYQKSIPDDNERWALVCFMRTLGK